MNSGYHSLLFCFSGVSFRSLFFQHDNATSTNFRKKRFPPGPHARRRITPTRVGQSDTGEEGRQSLRPNRCRVWCPPVQCGGWSVRPPSVVSVRPMHQTRLASRPSLCAHTAAQRVPLKEIEGEKPFPDLLDAHPSGELPARALVEPAQTIPARLRGAASSRRASRLGRPHTSCCRGSSRAAS